MPSPSLSCHLNVTSKPARAAMTTEVAKSRADLVQTATVILAHHALAPDLVLVHLDPDLVPAHVQAPLALALIPIDRTRTALGHQQDVPLHENHPTAPTDLIQMTRDLVQTVLRDLAPPALANPSSKLSVQIHRATDPILLIARTVTRLLVQAVLQDRARLVLSATPSPSPPRRNKLVQPLEDVVEVVRQALLEAVPADRIQTARTQATAAKP